MRLGLSTSVRPLRAGPDEVADLCERLAPELLALDPQIPPSLHELLTRRLLADSEDRPIRVVFAPCPAPPIGRGKRLPQLASVDREERLAAIRLVLDTVIRAADLSARVVVLPIAGRVPIPDRNRTIAEWFAWGFLDGAGPAQAKLRDWRALRARAAVGVVDGLRFSLEAVAKEAERRQLLLGLPTVGRYDEIPTRDEALTLLAELGGAPVGLWLDTAAAHAKEVLGFGPQATFVRELLAARPAPRLLGATVTDAAGLTGGLPPGRGEIDFATILSQLPGEAFRVVSCDPTAREDEVAAGLALIEAIPPAAAP